MNELREGNKRVETGKTIDDLIIKHCHTHACCMQDNKSELVLDIIEAKHSDLIKNIEWVGECESCRGRGGEVNFKHSNLCPKCNGIGKITRPATIEEVLGNVPLMLDIMQVLYKELPNIKATVEQALTINNGRLRIKEDI